MKKGIEIEEGMYLKGSLTDEQSEQMERDELNTCSMCGIVDSTYELIWLTEDFEPAEGEELKPSAWSKYDSEALCGNWSNKSHPHGCYYKCLTKKSQAFLDNKFKKRK